MAEPRKTPLASALTRAERAGRTLAWKVVRHASRLDDEAYLDRVAPATAGVPAAALLLDELQATPELIEALSSHDAARWREHEGRGERRGTPQEEVLERLDLDGVGRVRALLLYAALRRRRPAVVIETGCFTGWDSALILLALARNNHGHLYTLDLPGYSEDKPEDAPFQASLCYGGLPRDLQPGFLVPDGLRDRWTLRLGDARILLPELLGALAGPVDAFFHDSEHSYTHMMWEYTSVARHLAPGALLASDDLAFNTAFWDLCTAVGLQRVMHRGNATVGAAVWRS